MAVLGVEGLKSLAESRLQAFLQVEEACRRLLYGSPPKRTDFNLILGCGSVALRSPQTLMNPKPP